MVQKRIPFASNIDAETPETPNTDDRTLTERVIDELTARGFEMSMDSDHDPCFHVDEEEFMRRVGTPYYADLLKECGYTASYQVRVNLS